MTETVPFAMDSSNQAAWWTPVAVDDDSTWLAFNSPAAQDPFHEVTVARQTDGIWESACLVDEEGVCAVFVDDNGHNQPSIAVDGHGRAHVFHSMHHNQWRYQRSNATGALAFTPAGSSMADPQGLITYPVLASAPDGDVYVLARVGLDDWFSARLYRWDDQSATWSLAAVVAETDDMVPYPDSIQIGADGRVHIAWEWMPGGTGGYRQDGSYLVYDPATDELISPTGRVLTDPATPNDDDVVYLPEDGGVIQSAALSLADGEDFAGIAYRYRPAGETAFQVRWASHDDVAWQTERVTPPGDDTTAAIGATASDSWERIYYISTATCTELNVLEHGGLMMAERSVRGGTLGQWRHSHLGGGPAVERLSVATDSDDDVLYLAAPRKLDRDADPELRLARVARQVAPSSPLPLPVEDPVNLLRGSGVQVSSSASPQQGGPCAVDGRTGETASRWVSAPEDTSPELIVTMDQPSPIAEIAVHSGYLDQTGAIVSDFTVDAMVNGVWTEIATVVDNTASPAVVFVTDVTTDQLRFRFDDAPVRIYEVEAFAERRSSELIATAVTTDTAVLHHGDDTATVRVRVTNRGLQAHSTTLRAVAPAGVTVNEVAMTVSAGESREVNLHVTGSAGAAEGFFEMAVLAGEEQIGLIHLDVRDLIWLPTDGADVYTETGDWNTSGVPGWRGTLARWVDGGTGATATWTPDLPSPGRYRVSVWVPPGADTTTGAEVAVHHTGGSEKLVVDQSSTGGAWLVLGTWEFTGDGVGITVTATEAGYHRTGALRFEPV